MFKVGDRLICIASEDDCRANSLTPREEYEVVEADQEGVIVIGDDGKEVWVYNERFKLKEDTKVEKKECLFKEGQVVWDVVYGKGVVNGVEEDDFFPVKVEFDDGGHESYTLQGCFYECGTRTLYFSEPKIEAATEPLFEPTLKEGDKVVIEFEDGSVYACIVKEELEDSILTGRDGWIYKQGTKIFRVGEKINFK